MNWRRLSRCVRDETQVTVGSPVPHSKQSFSFHQLPSHIKPILLCRTSPSTVAHRNNHARNNPFFPRKLPVFRPRLTVGQPDVAERVAVYCEDHSTPLPKEIEAHKQFTRENFQDAEKMVSSLEAKLLPSQPFHRRANVFRRNCSSSLQRHFMRNEVLVSGTCRRADALVLEIGCYSGYSALAWAEALKNVEGAEVAQPRRRQVCSSHWTLTLI